MAKSLSSSLSKSMEGSKNFPSISGTYINICCVGSVLFGYGISYMNCMQDTMNKEFGWDAETSKQNFCVLSTAVFVGAAVGSFCGGFVSKYGRRTLNMALHAFFIIGSPLCCFANGFNMLLAGRLILGFAVGLVTVASPMIISEISPLETRGSNGVRHQLSITLGILMGIALGTPLNMDSFFMSQAHWMRFMLGLPAIISLIVLAVLAFWKKAETPNFLILNGKKDEAVKILRQVYQKVDVDSEYESLAAGLNTDGKPSVGLCSVLSDKWYRKTLIVGLCLAMGQQLSGINAFVSLSKNVFSNAGLSGQSLSLANTLMAVVNCLMTFPALFIIEASGRRPLYIIGTAGQAVSLALVPITCISPFSSALPIVSVVAVVGYIVFFAVSSGPVLWVYLNEIFPPELAGTACGLCCATNWIAGITVVYCVSYFEKPEYTIYIFGALSITSALVFLFCLFFLKETKGLSNAESPYLEGRNRPELKPLNSYVEKYV